MGTLFPFFRDRLAKRFFFILPADGGNSRKERKEIMKKLIALVLALTMALTLAACGGDAPETTGAPAASAIPGVEDGVLVGEIGV